MRIPGDHGFDADEIDTFAELSAALDRIRRSRQITLRELAGTAKVPLGALDRFLGDGVPPAPIRRSVFERIIAALDVEDVPPWIRAFERARTTHERSPESPGIRVEGSDNVHVNITNQMAGGDAVSPAPPAVSRQHFFFSFLHHSLWLTTTAFVLSMLFTAAGAIVTIWGAVILIDHAGDPNADYTPLVATLSGLVVAAGGGAFAAHANKARTHLTQRADQVREDIRGDIAFERATALIDRVQDSHTKDHMLSLTVAKELGLTPTPMDMGHLPQPKRIEVQRVDPPTELT